jgi:hypothetical protein
LKLSVSHLTYFHSCFVKITFMCCWCTIFIIIHKSQHFFLISFCFIYIKTKPKKDSFSFHLHSPLKIRERNTHTEKIWQLGSWKCFWWKQRVFKKMMSLVHKHYKLLILFFFLISFINVFFSDLKLFFVKKWKNFVLFWTFMHRLYSIPCVSFNLII